MKMDGLHKFLACVAMVSMAGLSYVCIREDYPQRLAARFGYEYHRTDWAVVGWTNCLGQLHHHADVVFLGDSITCGGNFQESFPGVSIANLGLPGDSLSGIMDRVDMIEALSPRKVFIMAGVNCLSWMSIKQYEKLIDKIIKTSISRGGVDIYVQSILPIEKHRESILLNNEAIKTFNTELKSLCDRRGIPFIDIYSAYEEGGVLNKKFSRDGVHLKKDAYRPWVEAVRPFI